MFLVATNHLAKNLCHLLCNIHPLRCLIRLSKKIIKNKFKKSLLNSARHNYLLSSMWAPSPWYKRNGWLGVKHQITYALWAVTNNNKKQQQNGIRQLGRFWSWIPIWFSVILSGTAGGGGGDLGKGRALQYYSFNSLRESQQKMNWTTHVKTQCRPPARFICTAAKATYERNVCRWKPIRLLAFTTGYGILYSSARVRKWQHQPAHEAYHKISVTLYTVTPYQFVMGVCITAWA